MKPKKRENKRSPLLTEAILSENAILAGLSPSMRTAFIQRGQLLSLETRQQIYDANQPIETVYFPVDAVLSVVAHLRNGGSIEVGTIGREGISAIPLLLGSTVSANESYCQVPGRAVAIPTRYFRELLLEANPRLRKLLDRFLQAYVNMLGQLAACNGMHTIYERTARWLLMTHDRVGSTEIRLTHEYLSMMLGARRSSVTIAAATLQQAGFIFYGQGHIKILNRQGLEDASCECYTIAREQFGELLKHKPA